MEEEKKILKTEAKVEKETGKTHAKVEKKVKRILNNMPKETDAQCAYLNKQLEKNEKKRKCLKALKSVLTIFDEKNKGRKR